MKLAESFSPITKKLDEVNESTQELGDLIKKSNSKIDLKSLPNNPKYSNSIRKMLGALRNSANFLKFTQDEFGRANILGAPIQISQGDTIKINEHICELTPEVYKSLSNPLYTGNTMNNDVDFLMLFKF